MDFALNVIGNILANIVFWLLFGVLSWVIIQVSQIRFARFFGFRSSRRYIVYLSNLWKPREGKLEGYILSEHEFRSAESINRLFGSMPFRFPEFVRGLVDSFWLGSAIEVVTRVSPVAEKQLSFSNNMIIVGGCEKNFARRYYIQNNTPYLVISNELESLQAATEEYPDFVKIMKGPRKDQVIDAPYNLAIIEKLRDYDHNVTVFMCVGYRADSSWGAVEYLVRHWKELNRRYGDKEFAICLGFIKGERYFTEFEEPVVLDRFPS